MPQTYRFSVFIDTDVNETPTITPTVDGFTIVYTGDVNHRLASTSGPTSYDDSPESDPA